MREFISFLGFVFEGAFKLGFVEGRPLDYQRFTDGIFNKLEEAGKDSELVEIVQGIRSCFPYQIHDPPEKMKGLSGLFSSHHEETEEGIKPEWKEIYTKLIFAIGYAGGYFYGKRFKSAELKKYHMGDESDDVIWKNADLAFIEKGTLHMVDLKLGGARKVLREIILKTDNRIPISTYGIPVNLSLGELEFYSFLEKFMQVKEKLRESFDVFVENKGLLQTLCYAVDFLCSERDPVSEVSLELIYPMHEPLNLRFFVKNRDKLREFLSELKELYRDIKQKEGSYREADTEGRIRKERIRKETEQSIKELQRKIEEREKESLTLETGDINSAREDVKIRLEDFVKKPETVKAIALLHSAGSGKTSMTREMILNLKGKHIVLYMATRLALLTRELEKLKEIKEKSHKSIELVYERGQSQSRRAIDRGAHFEAIEDQKRGKLKATVEEVYRLVQDKKPDIVWAFVTIQALVETAYGNKTSEHLKLLQRPTLRDYHIHIILDEFFGYKNGLFAITEMLRFLEDMKSKGRKASLYIFDANGYSPNLLEKLIKEYEEFEVIPDSLVLSQYDEELKTHYRYVPFEIYARHGFPANGLMVYKKFMKVEREEQIPKLVANYIKSTLKKGESTGFAFIQNKELIVKVSKELYNVGLSSMRATASSKKSQEQINNGTEDVILGTSSVSRGLDFSRPHKPVDHIYIVIQAWNIEHNLVETIQALSRSRGDEETESRQKHLHLIYIISQNIDYRVENIVSYMDHPDKDLVRLIYTKEQLEGFLDLDLTITRIVEQFLSKPKERVLVPVPTQHRSRYINNVISKYENAFAFVEDIYDMEKGDDINRFINLLKSTAYTYTTLKRLEDLKGFDYYHPYILLEDHEIYLKINNEKVNELKKLFEKIEPVLEEHNRERAQEVKDFLYNVLPTEENKAPLLIPVYSIVFVKNWLRENEKLEFRISNRVGRGHAEVLGGGLEPETLCYLGSPIEYACIPLGENYPYKEVLSGRFAKFPVKFIKSLLEG